jgi:hypothetical protein
MIFLLYIFKGKIEHLSNAFTFDTWNTFQYYTYPSNGKYACCYGLYGSDGCKEYVNEVKRDPVIDEVNDSKFDLDMIVKNILDIFVYYNLLLELTS